MRLDFFDCNAQIGRFGIPVPESVFTPEELLDKLAPPGIRRALVYHALAKELHPAEGNAILCEEITTPMLVGCWVAMPPHTGEMPDPAQFVSEMRAARVPAVRLFPALHNFSLADWCSGEMLAAFECAGLPVFLELGQSSWDQIALVLQSHPKLRLTVLQTSYRCDRFLYPLLERYSNLSIDISSYMVSGGIEAVCTRFGASRMLFGTGSPMLEPGGPVAALTYADLSNEDKQMIAAGNLEALLRWLDE